MAKILLITNFLGQRSIAPLAAKGNILNYNNISGADKKVKIQEVEEDEANNIISENWIDPNHVTPAKAQDKLMALAKESSEKDAKIKELLAKLEEANKAAGKPNSIQEANKVPLKAEEVIDKIKLAKSVEEVDQLIIGDERKTVLDAASKKSEELGK